MIKIARDDTEVSEEIYDDFDEENAEDALEDDYQSPETNDAEDNAEVSLEDTAEDEAAFVAPPTNQPTNHHAPPQAPISNFANHNRQAHKNFLLLNVTKSILVWLFGSAVMLWMIWGSGFHTLTKYSGLSLRDVQIYNLDKTDRNALLAQVDLQRGESIFKVDLQQTKMAIDELPWVEQSHIVRVLPDSLHIYITEHRPVAIWQQNGEKTLVSHDGSPIGAVENFTDYENLPVITGNAAPKSFTLLQSVLESYPELQNALRGAKMSRAARWTIYLENGTLVHLPIHNIDEAFIRLRWLDKQFQVLSFQSSVIDLRVRDRAAIGERTIPVAVQNKTDDTANASS